MDKKKTILQARQLLALRDSEDHSDINRRYERELAEEKLKKLIKRTGIGIGEIITSIPVEKKECRAARKSFGCFYLFPLYYKGWPALKQCLPKNSCETLGENGTRLFELPKRKSTPLIKDPNLDRAIREQLGLGEDRELGLKELSLLKVLDAAEYGITNLDGLEYAYKLTFLDLSGNPIKDISVLEHLGHLRMLDLSNTQVENLNALSELAYLKFLNLLGLKVQSLKPIAGLTLLKYVNVQGLFAADGTLVVRALKYRKIKVIE